MGLCTTLTRCCLLRPLTLLLCLSSPAAVSVTFPGVSHDNVLTWTQLAKKVVQSVSEHAGSEYIQLPLTADQQKQGVLVKLMCVCTYVCLWRRLS